MSNTWQGCAGHWSSTADGDSPCSSDLCQEYLWPRELGLLSMPLHGAMSALRTVVNIPSEPWDRHNLHTPHLALTPQVRILGQIQHNNISQQYEQQKKVFLVIQSIRVSITLLFFFFSVLIHQDCCRLCLKLWLTFWQPFSTKWIYRDQQNSLINLFLSKHKTEVCDLLCSQIYFLKAYYISSGERKRKKI